MSSSEFLVGLNRFIALTNSLFSLLASPSSSTSLPPSTTALYRQLAATHTELAALLLTLEKHQRQRIVVNSLVQELRVVEEAWTESTIILQRSVQKLDPIIRSSKQDIINISQACPPPSASLPISDSPTTASSDAEGITTKTLLAFARHLAPFTSAPPTSLFSAQERELDYTTGRGLPEGANPPFPLEDMLRRGRLLFDSADQAGLGSTTDAIATAGADGEGRKVETEEERLESIKGKIEFERRRQSVIAAQRAQREEEEDDFGFDLDLNPDL